MNYYKRIKEAQKIIAATKGLDMNFFGLLPSDDDYKSFYGAGYWDHLLLGKDQYNTFYALRVVPGKDIKRWPLVESRKLKESTMYASSLSVHSIKDFIYASGDKESFLIYHNAFERIQKKLTPVYKILEIEDSLNNYLNYIGDINNCPSWTSEESRDNKHQKELNYENFYKKLDTSFAHIKYREIVNAMMSSEECIPNIPNDDYGAWQPSIYKYIANRSYFNYFDQEITDFANIIWRSFIECHSYDNKSLHMSQNPGTGESPSSFYSSIVSPIINFPEDFPEEILNHPLMEAAKAMPLLGRVPQTIYTGAMHLKAASVLDKEFNDAKGCWNALANHSFWLGKALKNREALGLQQMTAVQALSLAEENNWKDAVYILRQTVDMFKNWV